MKKVVVIGAGIAGLAAAIRLRAAGHEVTIYEANAYAGGKLTEIRGAGYRFDAGPSLFTMPQYVDELFTLAGKDPRDYFQYERLSTICKYFWDDGTELTTSMDKEKTAQNISNTLGESSKVVRHHLSDAETKYNLTGRTFLEHSLHKLKSWLHSSTVTSIMQLYKLDLHRSMHGVNKSRFTNAKTVQLFDRYATYNGSNPYKTPGLLNIIPHYEYGFGAYYPKDGMHSIIKAILKLTADLGIEIKYNSKVESIQHENGKVTGVLTYGDFKPADIVISNMDVYYTYKYLLERKAKARQIKKQERSSSALIFYWGVKGKFPELDLHNIFFAEDYKAEFDAINRGEVHDDPTVYVNISSKHTESDSPADSENWFTMINVPHDSGQDWKLVAEQARKNVIAKLSSLLHVSLSELIEYEDILDPVLIDKRTSSHTGSLYGTSSNSMWAAFLRHPNFTSTLDGLYHCGGSVHPGGGIPLCLLSAKIVDDLIRTKFSSK